MIDFHENPYYSKSLVIFKDMSRYDCIFIISTAYFSQLLPHN